MDKIARDRWIVKLERGAYRQSALALCTPTGYCCLGVLCEVAVEDGIINPPEIGHGGEYRYDGCSSYLPPSVMEAYGIDTPNGSFGDGTGDDREFGSLSSLNDTGMSFADIAKVIKEHF